MSLQFVFGPSGAGKSRFIYERILEEAAKNRRRNYLVIVPDQFTMQTQKDLTGLSPSGGIMNIDVLSFGRLNHRIMEEVGRENIPILDDTGKCLVLQKVAAGLKEDMPALGSFLHRQGYIHEVKSAISEFMQYGIGVQDMDKLIACAENRGALAQKLKDLKVIYKGFLEYMEGKYITTEETLDVLGRSLSRSALIKDSVVVFDGFTGFTPIQYRVIGELMRLSRKVIITVSMGEQENPYILSGEQNLFCLGKKTTADLLKVAADNWIPRDRDLFVLPISARGNVTPIGNMEYFYSPSSRFDRSPALAHLERALFRFPGVKYTEEQQEIFLFDATNPAGEVRQTGLKIKELVREKGLAYRDIAVVSGDLEGYAPYVETEFARMDIPCFVDRTRGIVLNPLVEYIKSALAVFQKNYSYDAVFHYLRSGLADMTPEETDLFENYILATGIKGVRAYNRPFTKKTKEIGEDEALLSQINSLRERMAEALHVLSPAKSEKVSAYVDKLYDFLVHTKVQEKLTSFAQIFHEQGELSREREYAQIYRLIMELLEQIYSLLGEETITLQEFSEILEAGFGEIEVGTIPQNVDRVVVGDMERTRLKEIKVLFFMGVNDGNIPRNASKGGIISDMDREFLRESSLELAPSPRQQMFIQRLYLYLNMTKPSEKLYLSYAKISSAGKSLRPAYLADTLRGLFPKLTTEHPELRSPLEQIVTIREGEAYLAADLRKFAAGELTKERQQELFTVYNAFSGGEAAAAREKLTNAAFRRYLDSPLSKAVTQALYGRNLLGSVSGLETYASCAYRYFLEYGLKLKERQEFVFESADLGNVYHDVLQKFGNGLEKDGKTWFDFSREYAEQAVKSALQKCAEEYGETILFSNARNAYAVQRMERILIRTVTTIQRQLKKGQFKPSAYECSFTEAGDSEALHIALTEEEKMHLRGRIDRIDTLEDDRHVYVKVVDYKSGEHAFDLAAVYYGLQLQLVVYMNAAMEIEKKQHPDKEVVPAAMLYYHIEDPMVESAEEIDQENLEALLMRQLRMKGVVSAEPGIAEKMDPFLEGSSDVLPVGKTTKGVFSAKSSVLKGEELAVVSKYATGKLAQLGREILQGKISLNPSNRDDASACDWCSFKGICGFETSLGCEKRELQKMEKDKALEMMRRVNEVPDLPAED